ncbi:hypothetical protein ACJIZ3_015074 [Penstemon smallii]|uniref:Transmembrane protein n=1 Tax=Penstemon smallii TaxID=265156 RepID=A0ABD3RT01_9LAMI
MELLLSEDTTTLSYWLNWRVLLCSIWVLSSIFIGLYLIWKYELSDNSEIYGKRTQQESLSNFRYDLAWKPCLSGIHPIYLMLFRIIAFCLLFVAVSFDVAVHGFELYYYYTQWAFTLVTIYFGFGSLISIHGCYHNREIKNSSNCHFSKDMEQGLYTPLAPGLNENGEKLLQRLNHPGKFHLLLTYDFWSYLFQVLFQITAGAVTLTDLVYWCVMFPFLTIKDYELSFLTVVAHSLNAVMILGETALNSLQFPWFRISYFLLLTGIYVLFQWIVHASVSMWWPYPFLELSVDFAPLWYLVVALLHVPCYGIFVLAVKVKHHLLSRWFPHSYRFCQ